MYLGDNQTALESQKAIGNAFLELMNEKQYSSISVKEICSRAGVSRQTFYSLFETKENVIRYQMKRDCQHPGTKCKCLEGGKMCIDIICDSFAGFIYHNFDFLKLMMENDQFCVIYSAIYQILVEGNQGKELWVKDHEEEVYSFMTGGITSFISSVVTDEANKDLDYLKETMKFLFLGEFFNR